MFQFQFVNSFLSLFYIAFYLQDQARLREVTSHRNLKFLHKHSCLQQLATLLIARQVIGNLKESALPYILEHMRLAKMSFDMWGALSPQNTRAPPGGGGGDEPPETADTEAESWSKRSMSQAELESSLYKVGL